MSKHREEEKEVLAELHIDALGECVCEFALVCELYRNLEAEQRQIGRQIGEKLKK